MATPDTTHPLVFRRPPNNALPQHLADLDLPLPAPFDAFKLVGFSVWRAPDDKLYLTFPARSRAFGATGEYYVFLQVIRENDRVAMATFTAWLLDEYRKWAARDTPNAPETSTP